MINSLWRISVFNNSHCLLNPLRFIQYKKNKGLALLCLQSRLKNLTTQYLFSKALISHTSKTYNLVNKNSKTCVECACELRRGLWYHNF